LDVDLSVYLIESEAFFWRDAADGMGLRERIDVGLNFTWESGTRSWEGV
tara:strand:- start:994 stop:1140 length:147 start_codon:yes stop_codon:yes gene_type:complete